MTMRNASQLFVALAALSGCVGRSLPPTAAGSTTSGGTTSGGTTAAGTTGSGTTTTNSSTTAGGTTSDAGVGCAHDYCQTGSKLDPACNPCVATICAADDYCCTNHWSGPCVSEVDSICNMPCSGGSTAGGTTGGIPVGPSTTTGTTAGGGSKSALLHFAVFGDARPPQEDDTTDYPSAIIGGIFSLAQSRGAQFVIGTGDYMYAGTPTAVNAQTALFLAARANYSGPVYLTMGNHECTGATASNCPNLDETPNVQAFMGQLVPAGVNQPFYRVDILTPNGTAKFLFVAANAWSTAQATWLATQLADSTAYTFAIRHEPPRDTTALGVIPSEKTLLASSYTLELLGHTHEYRHIDAQHVISGNAGAPLSADWNSYGLLIIDQQKDGNITVTEVDESTGSMTDTWTVTASGAPVP